MARASIAAGMVVVAGCGLPTPVTSACALEERAELADLDAVPDGMDFAVSAGLAVLAGAFVGEITWSDGSTSGAQWGVEVSGPVELHTYSEPERCAAQYAVPVAVSLVSDDGRLAEAADTTLIIATVDAASLHLGVGWDALVGTATPRVLDLDELAELDLELSGVADTTGWTLALTWIGREVTVEDAEFEVDERREAAGTGSFVR